MFGAFRHRHLTFQYKNSLSSLLMFVHLIDRAEGSLCILYIEDRNEVCFII